MKSRKFTWLAWLALIPAVIAAFVFGLWVYVSITAETLHPNPQEVPSVSNAAPLPKWTDAAERGRQIVRASLAEQNLPGMSVAVGIGGDVVWAEGFGWSDLENRERVAPNTRFRIGNASIVLTSAAAGLLLEKERLKLDAEIQTYVPTYPKKPWPVTLRQLMGHVAGVRTDGGDEGPFGERCEQTVEGLKLFENDSLRFEPGTRYHFSSFGWILVSAAIETAADVPFMAYIRDQIFEPLGMRDTLPDSATEPIANRASFYFPRFGADPKYGLHPTRPLDFSCYAGAMAFLSTPSDLVRFGMAISNGKLLQPVTVQLLQTSQRLRSGGETGYGLGWDLETVDLAGEQARVIGHDGETMGGTVVSLMTFPDHGLVVAVTSNLSYADTFAVGLKIAEAFARR